MTADDRILPRDSLGMDPSRVHPFVENDHNRVCYRCDRKRTDRIHAYRAREDRIAGR